MNYILFIFYFLFLCFSDCQAQTQVTEYSPAGLAEGVVYSLPRTAITVDVKAIKTVYTPGEFAKYAERYLHVNGVKRQSETAWSIEDIKVSTEGVPDTLKTYVVKQKDKSSAWHMQLTDKGTIAAINTTQPLPNSALPETVTTHHARDGKKYMTAEMLEATSTAKMAEIIAQEIFDIRESKNLIRRGQAENMPKDGASLRIVLDDLDAQEEALLQMFVGYTDTTTTYTRYSMVPTGDVHKDVLFRFSKKIGFVDKDDLAGEPYYISVTDKHSTKLPDEKEASKRKINGVVYNLPGSANVMISSMGKIIYDMELPMAQFGTVDILDNALFNKGAAPKITFIPSTGALLKLE